MDVKRRDWKAGILLPVLALLIAGFAGSVTGERRQEGATKPAPGVTAEKTDTFRIAGDVEKPGAWTVERVRKELPDEIKTVAFVQKGDKGEAHCVPLTALITAAAPRYDPKIKEHRLAWIVLVRARDGYTVAFSLGEMLSEFGKRQVWLALDRNGNPHNDRDAPATLLVPEDGKFGRWEHAVRSITLLDGHRLLGKTSAPGPETEKEKP